MSGVEITLQNSQGLTEGEFSLEEGKYVCRKSNFTEADLSAILPLQIEIRNSGSSSLDYDGVVFEIHTLSSGSTVVTDDTNSRYLYGKFQKQETVATGCLDYTRNVSVCSDGLLLQGKKRHALHKNKRRRQHRNQPRRVCKWVTKKAFNYCLSGL